MGELSNNKTYIQYFLNFYLYIIISDFFSWALVTDHSTIEDPDILKKIERRLLQENYKDTVFGLLRPLKTDVPTQLPTYSDIGKYVAYIKAKENMIRSQFKEKKSGLKFFKNADIFDKVANDIINIHVLASVPCLPKHKIVEKIGKLWDMKADNLKEKG